MPHALRIVACPRERCRHGDRRGALRGRARRLSSRGDSFRVDRAPGRQSIPGRRVLLPRSREAFSAARPLHVRRRDADLWLPSVVDARHGERDGDRRPRRRARTPRFRDESRREGSSRALPRRCASRGSCASAKATGPRRAFSASRCSCCVRTTSSSTRAWRRRLRWRCLRRPCKRFAATVRSCWACCSRCSSCAGSTAASSSACRWRCTPCGAGARRTLHSLGWAIAPLIVAMVAMPLAYFVATGSPVPISGAIKSSFPAITWHGSYFIEPLNVAAMYGWRTLLHGLNVWLCAVLLSVGLAGVALRDSRASRATTFSRSRFVAVALVANLLLFQKWEKSVDPRYFALPMAAVMFVLVAGVAGATRRVRVLRAADDRRGRGGVRPRGRRARRRACPHRCTPRMQRSACTSTLRRSCRRRP